MPTVGFLYSGSPQSLRGQYNAFRHALPIGVNVWPPTAAASGVGNNYGIFSSGGYSTDQQTSRCIGRCRWYCVRSRRKRCEASAGLQHKDRFHGCNRSGGGTGLKPAGGDLTGVAGMTTDLDAARLRSPQDAVPGLATVGVLEKREPPEPTHAVGVNLTGRSRPGPDFIPGDVNPPPAPGRIRQVIQALVAHPVQALPLLPIHSSMISVAT